MKAAIHQPHFMPWLGYMDKMAKADIFIILDEVQLTKRSPMHHNKFVSWTGNEKILSVSYEKKGCLECHFKDLNLNTAVPWQSEHVNFLRENYKKAKHYDEIWKIISKVYEKKYSKIFDVDMDTIYLIKELLDISTRIVFQSELDYDRTAKKDDLMLALSQAVGADIYLSGNGARKYMQDEKFIEKGVQVVYQQFVCPEYVQVGGHEFIPNASSLDLLFNEGLEESRRIFWENVNKTREFA